jgi:hypothetical protein
MSDDDPLKHAFEALRREDARRAPSFEAVTKKRVRRASPWMVALPAASALAAAAVLVVWCGTSTMNAPPPPPTVAVASSPSAPLGGLGALGGESAPAPAAAKPLDFLLHVPGLRGAPDFDTSLLQGSLR